MNVTTYLGGDLIERAQAVLSLHTVSSADGLCLACAVPGPCARHEEAAAVFARSLRLPRRKPGATHPERVGRQRSGERGWFDQRVGC
jgi:hypothetical protein